MKEKSMKRLIFLSILSILSINHNSVVASTLKDVSEAVGNELVRLGKVPSFSKDEKIIEEKDAREIRNQREELEVKFTQGNLDYSEYAAQDEIIARQLPVRNMTQDTEKEEKMSENALHSKIIVLANKALMEYLKLSNENSLDVTAKNKTGNEPAFTVSNIVVKQSKEDESWGDYNSNHKVFSFTDLTANRSSGKTIFSFAAEVSGFDLKCQVVSSWRLYGKTTNQHIFNGGRISNPSDIIYSPQS